MQHPATQALYRILRQWRADLKDQWASGAYTDLSQYGTAILNAKAIGTCEAFEKILELDFEQMLGEADDSKHERA